MVRGIKFGKLEEEKISGSPCNDKNTIASNRKRGCVKPVSAQQDECEDSAGEAVHGEILQLASLNNMEYQVDGD